MSEHEFNRNSFDAVLSRIETGLATLSKTTEDNHTAIIVKMDSVAKKLSEHDDAITRIQTADHTKKRMLAITLSCLTLAVAIIELLRSMNHHP